MKNFKIGEKVKDTRHAKSPVITVIGVFTDNYVSGKYVINGIEHEADYKISDIQIIENL